MRADDAQRVTIAREYLASARQTGVEQLPPSRLLLEVAELRRQLGIVLAIHADQPPALTARQQAAAEHARALAAIPSYDDEALAVFTGHEDLATVYGAAFAEANHTIRGLLDVIDGLTGGAS